MRGKGWDAWRTPHLGNCRVLVQPMLGEKMGEVIRFVPRYERERARLIREARAIYDSIFPSVDPVNHKQSEIPLSRAAIGADACRGDGGLVS
jgi:hypothetical protein